MPDQRCRRSEAWLAALVRRWHHHQCATACAGEVPLPDVAGRALQTNKDLTNKDQTSKDLTSKERIPS